MNNCSCDLCKKTGLAASEIFVLSGPGPQSFVYCEECVKLGIYPINGWISYLYTIWPNVVDSVRPEIEKSLNYANKTWEWFEQEVSDACAKLDEYFENMDKLKGQNNDEYEIGA